LKFDEEIFVGWISGTYELEGSLLQRRQRAANATARVQNQPN
jgi:hypothetical protein